MAKFLRFVGARRDQILRTMRGMIFSSLSLLTSLAAASSALSAVSELRNERNPKKNAVGSSHNCQRLLPPCVSRQRDNLEL